VAGFWDEIRSTLRASELAGLDLLDILNPRPMPDRWNMPAGVDLRSFFLVPSEPLAAGRLGAARSR